MPKPPTLTATQVIGVLVKKGFVLDRSSGSHRIYRHPKSHKRAVVPFHRRDLPRGTLMEILRQAGIDKKEFETLL